MYYESSTPPPHGTITPREHLLEDLCTKTEGLEILFVENINTNIEYPWT